MGRYNFLPCTSLPHLNAQVAVSLRIMLAESVASRREKAVLHQAFVEQHVEGTLQGFLPVNG
jgi:hypothetical protein